MERQGWLASQVPFLGAAGLLAVFLARSGPTPAPVPRLEPSTRPPGTGTPAATRAPSGIRPALELLAEHLGIPKDPGSRGRAFSWIEAEAGVRAEASHPTRARAAKEAAVALSKQKTPLPASELATLAGAGFEDSLGAKHIGTLVDESVRQWEDDALLEAVKRRLGTGRDQPEFDLAVLIASFPDYVDSYSAWTFDGNLDALQRAAGVSGFVIDRFYLPDWDPEQRGDETRGDRHETEPGALLFRSVLSPKELLLVLVTLETATAGIHKRAFLSAVQLSRQLAPKGDVRVLGPNFSGSVRSIRVALQAWVDEVLAGGCDGPVPRVLIRAGGATNRVNKAFLEEPFDCGGRPGSRPKLVDYAAFTVSDTDAQIALSDFLGTLRPEWAYGDRVALLIEATTTFGASQETVEPPKPRLPGRLESGPPCRAEKAMLFPCATRLSFPLHISRLRAEAGGPPPPSGKTGPLGTGAVSLRLDEARTPRDQVPPMRPQPTAALVDTSLALILDSIERTGVTAVGLYGTDPRDRIFLAQQISRRSPNVLIFTLEPSLAFLHPELKAFMRGAIVASSYPLFSATQTLLPSSDPTRSTQQQFPTAGAQGVYNAFLSLMGRPDRMLDYGWGCGTLAEQSGAKCRPSIWISVVGHDALWPLRRYPLAPEVNRGYTWPLAAFDRSSDPAIPAPKGRASASPMAVLAAALAAVAILVHALIGVTILWQVIRGSAKARPGRRQSFDVAGAWLLGRLRRHAPVFEPPDFCAQRWTGSAVAGARLAILRHEYWVSLAACGGALLAVGIFLTHLLAIGLDTGADLDSAHRGLPYATLRRVSLLVFGLALGAALWPTRLRRQAALGKLIALRTVPVLVGLVALGYLELYLTSAVWQGPLAGLAVMRTMDVRSLVSPLVPVVALSVAVYVWGLWNLLRLHDQAVEFGPSAALVLSLGQRSGLVAALRSLLDAPALAVGLLAGILLGCGLVLEWRLEDRIGLTAADGADLSGFVATGTMLVSFLVGHTLSFGVRQGRTLLRGLRALDPLPLGRALGLLSKEPQVWRLSAGMPRASEVARLSEQAQVFCSALESMTPYRLMEVRDPAYGNVENDQRKGGPRPGATSEKERTAADEKTRATALALRIRPEDVGLMQTVPEVLWIPESEEDEKRPLQGTPVWQELSGWSQHILRVLERGPWRGEPEVAGGLPEPYRQGERLVALQVAYTLRHSLVRLLKVFATAAGGLVLLFSAHLFYLFQGRVFWLGLDWILIGLATLVILSLLVRLEKDAVLSRLWATDPGRLNWNGELVHRILVYGALPVIAIFVTKFPEVGASLFSWLEPVQKVIP